MFKQTSVAFIALLGSSAAAAAQAPAPAGCAKPSFADRVTLNPVAASNLMTVPVQINGTAKQFLLDVGGGPDEISAAAAAALALPQTDQKTVGNSLGEQNSTFQFQAPVFDVRSTASRRNFQRSVRAADFTLGAATLHDMQLLVSGDAEMGKSKPYDGLLTAGGFRQYDMDVDFGGKSLSFLAPTACTDPHQIVYWPHSVVAVIPMTPGGGKITVPVTIAGHAIDAVIDTGSDHTVMRRAIAERVFGLASADMAPDGDLRDGAGERVYLHTFPPDRLRRRRRQQCSGTHPVQQHGASAPRGHGHGKPAASRARTRRAHPRPGAGHGCAAPAPHLCRVRPEQALRDPGGIAIRFPARRGRSAVEPGARHADRVRRRPRFHRPIFPPASSTRTR